MIERQKLSEFANKIHNLFGLEAQGAELLTLVTETIGCNRACLLFLDLVGDEYNVIVCSPVSKCNPFPSLSLGKESPIAIYLAREKKLLTRERLDSLPERYRHPEGDREKLYCDKIELLLPMISRDRLIAILVMGEKTSGEYSADDYRFLEDVIQQVAVSMEKEYLREQLGQLYSEVEKKARIDGLTGLLNRRSLDEAINNEINRCSRYGGIFSLIILDLESLKAVNDNYGHQVGDELLRRIGVVMKDSIRSADQAFRYGGDEFAILLPNTPIDSSRMVAERIRRQIASLTIAGSASVTASLGIAGWPASGREADEIIGAADMALYVARRNGGNRCHADPNI